MSSARTERRKAERAREKAARRFEKHLELVDAGRDVVRAGGWPSWSPFILMQPPGSLFCEEVGCHSAYQNSRYQVLVIFEESGAGWPPMAHLSIKAHDKRAVHDWRDMQRIKNELMGPEAEALELYPADSRLMDEANQYHLYCVPPGIRLPFGKMVREMATPEQLEEEFAGVPRGQRPVQREFEDHHGVQGCRPEGLVEWPAWAKERVAALRSV